MKESAPVPVSRSRLESLSTDELIKLADSYGIDIPWGLERIFIIEELLEASNADAQNETSDMEGDSSFPETAQLPKKYNISYIEAIIRDPLWIFVFWEVKGSDREIHENASDFKGYCLRLTPLDKDGKEPKSKEDSFTVPVGTEDNARYLSFAEQTETDSNCFIIKLGVIRGETETHIASSLPFYMPRLCENEIISGLRLNPLIRLSGAQDLSITRNTVRQPRIRRQR